jgi:predicted metal-dependent hydrolase
MIAGESGGRPVVPNAEDQERLSWRRRIVDFVQNVLRLESAVGALKKDAKVLAERIALLQEQMLTHEGELRVLLQFVHKALESAIESRAEKVAIGVFERMSGTGRKRRVKKRSRKDRT